MSIFYKIVFGIIFTLIAAMGIFMIAVLISTFKDFS